MNKKTKKKNFFIKSLIYVFTLCLVLFVTFVALKTAPAVFEKFKSITQSESVSEVGLLDLVNSTHPYSNRSEDGLVSIYEYKNGSYFVKDKNVLLDERAMKPLNDMMKAFEKETGISNVNVISAYRTVEYQDELFKKYVLQNGKDYAKRFCQKPGKSEHHTGLAIDLAIFHKEDKSSEDFTGEGEYAWFFENSWRYGFIHRYDAKKESLTGIGYEPWHFRFVGKKAAKEMFEKDLCLEEYIQKLNFQK